MKSPIVQAMEYRLHLHQMGWIRTALRYPYVAHLGSRKIGKDFTWTALVAYKVLTSRCTWNLFSATQTHATQVLKDVKAWIEYFSRWHFNLTEGKRCPTIKLDNTRLIELSNGSKVFSHPATLRAAVGLRGSVIFNEVGQIPHARELYEGVAPTVSSAIRYGHKANLIIISNATHTGHWWHSWWEGIRPEVNGSSAGFAKIKTTLKGALTSQGWSKQKIDAAVRETKAQMGHAAYAQWYDCQWRAAEGQFFPPDLVQKCSYSDFGEELKRQKVTKRHGILGFDIGRHTDPSAIATGLMVPNSMNAIFAPIWCESGWHFKAQRQQIQREANMWCDHTWGLYADGTSLQCVLVEELQRDHEVQVRPITSVPIGYQSKWALAGGLKSGMEQGLVRFANDTDLHMDFSMVSMGKTPGGSPRLEWGRKRDSEGQVSHGERFMAMGLAYKGISGGSAQRCF